ncbi:MAG TPA: ABC transporter ATP-binding protein [Planctomycetota bacterium]|nr:ABC transporter ATP-binding protein [Planctomycetota bacterium]
MVGFAGFSPSRKEHLIRVQKVTKEYSCGPSTVKALRQATLTLEAGEFVLLQGTSGSGKTTLLSIMGCLMKPTSGRIVVAGKDVTDMGESELPALRLKHIGFIFQTFNLFPALTARQNVTLALQLKGYGWRQRNKEAARLLDRVGLTKEMDRKPGDMSGGQRQRVCIARALAGDSDIILADEPTAALDTATGLEIMELLKEQTRTGTKACFVVTHDPRLEKFATRVDRITDGILNVGAPVRIRGAAAGEVEKPVLSGTVSNNTPIGLPSISAAH